MQALLTPGKWYKTCTSSLLTGARRGKSHLPLPLLSPSDLSQRMKNCVCLENLLVEIFQIWPQRVEVEVVLLSVSWLCNLLLQRNNGPAWEFPAAIGWYKFKVRNLHTSAKDTDRLRMICFRVHKVLGTGKWNCNILRGYLWDTAALSQSSLNSK